jgi:hypothetical protein
VTAAACFRLVLADRPKLKNDLRGSSMEPRYSNWRAWEARSGSISKWLLVQSVAPKTKIESVITNDAVAMLGGKLSTPLAYRLIREIFELPCKGRWPNKLAKMRDPASATRTGFLISHETRDYTCHRKSLLILNKTHFGNSS